MIQVSEVSEYFGKYGDVEAGSDLAESCCQRGLKWVYSNLRDNVSLTDPLITPTAAAVAHYYYCTMKLGETDRYESYKAGDMTVKRNIARELESEEKLRKQAIIDARSILKDGGFYFSGT